jgi:mannose-6-phosphate isomerase-like protein (cupin superfamily)
LRYLIKLVLSLLTPNKVFTLTMTTPPASQTDQVAMGYYEDRPWGNFLVLLNSETCKVKRLQVTPGQRLSLQLHHHRQEHWVVTQGTPTITLGDKTWQAQPGEYIHIVPEQPHRLSNPTTELVELIEVQMGTYFGEDDIVRLQDDYQR